MSDFSQKLQRLLKTDQPVTLQAMIDSFAEKSFAVLLLMLMAIPALPLPTGGVTHIFEIIAMLLSIEMIIGRQTVWLPKRWLVRPLPRGLQTTALKRVIKIISWAEKISGPTFSRVGSSSLFTRLLGIITLLFSAFAFLAPPFSGLDTLPSFGVVVLSLALIFEDALLAVIGTVLGLIGIGLIIILGRLALQLL